MVDRSTDVEIRGDMATLRNNYGVPARFERFECTGALPALPSDLRIRAVEGAGRITLTHDSDNAGVAVIHVRNSEGDSQMYTFDVYWDNNARRSQSGFAERSSDDEAVESCRNAVENRVRRDGYRGVQFGNIAVDERGPSDFVTGTASARLGYRDEGFSFTCRVTPDGNVRALDVTRH